jgi:hypothetical protein
MECIDGPEAGSELRLQIVATRAMQCRDDPRLITIVQAALCARRLQLLF